MTALPGIFTLSIGTWTISYKALIIFQSIAKEPDRSIFIARLPTTNALEPPSIESPTASSS